MILQLPSRSDDCLSGRLDSYFMANFLASQRVTMMSRAARMFGETSSFSTTRKVSAFLGLSTCLQVCNGSYVQAGDVRRHCKRDHNKLAKLRCAYVITERSAARCSPPAFASEAGLRKGSKLGKQGRSVARSTGAKDGNGFGDQTPVSVVSVTAA